MRRALWPIPPCPFIAQLNRPMWKQEAPSFSMRRRPRLMTMLQWAGVGKNAPRKNKHQNHRRENKNRKCPARHNSGTQSFLFSFYSRLFCFAAGGAPRISWPVAIHCDDRNFKKENRRPVHIRAPYSNPQFCLDTASIPTRSNCLQPVMNLNSTAVPAPSHHLQPRRTKSRYQPQSLHSFGDTPIHSHCGKAARENRLTAPLQWIYVD